MGAEHLASPPCVAIVVVITGQRQACPQATGLLGVLDAAAKENGLVFTSTQCSGD